MLRPPSRSPLFPYTTLFRSPRHPEERDGPDPDQTGEQLRGVRADGDVPGPVDRVIDAEHAQLLAGLVDRKSTRLNSSHLGISYAVVCLKKKTGHAAQVVVFD